jgi:hypothetical protein
MKIPLLACANSWNSSALSLPKWVNRTLLTWRHRDTYGATPGSLQLGDPMAYGSSAGQPQGRAFAPLVSRLLLVAAAIGPGRPGLRRCRQGGQGPVGPGSQVCILLARAVFRGAEF